MNGNLKIVVNCVKAHSREDEYFYSGYSRHMIREKTYLEDLKLTKIVMSLLVIEQKEE